MVNRYVHTKVKSNRYVWIAAVVSLLIAGGCSYKMTFGGDPSGTPAPKKSDVDRVIDEKVKYPDGYNIPKKGLHWGW